MLAMPPSSSSSSASSEEDIKKSAWRRPPPPSIGAAFEAANNHVMGADSWPALGESSIKSDSIKNDSTPVPAVACHHTKGNNHHPNSNRLKPMRLQTNGGGSSSNHEVSGGPVSPQLTGHGQEPPPRDMNNNRSSSNWDHGSSTRGNGYSPHRPFNRRGNNGGGGSGGIYNGGRRDPDHGGYSNDWNNPSPRYIPPPPAPQVHHARLQYVRSPPPPPPPPCSGVATFVGPLPHVRPFVGPPIGFPAEIPSPVFYVPAPPHFVATHPVGHAIAPAMFLNPAEYQAQSATVLKQIEYYFSTENLCKDMYLRKHMDEQGWVPVSLIAGFNRVKQCTQYIPNSINFILDTVRASELVELEGDKIRRRGDWNIWILSSQSSNSSGPHSQPVVNVDGVVDQMRNVVLEGTTSNNSTGVQTLSEHSTEDKHGPLASDR